MFAFNRPKKSICLAIVVLVGLLLACGAAPDQNAKNSPDTSKKDKKSAPEAVGFDPIERSFVLREGTNSCITSMALDRKGNIFAAGFADNNCVIFELGPDLKEIRKMAKFGSAKDGGYFAQDTIKDMAIDSQGNIFVVGFTSETDFPVTPGAYDTIINDNAAVESEDGFVTKYSPEFKLLASTALGASRQDKAMGIAIDPHDNIYVTGYTESNVSKYCKSGPFQTTPGAFDSDPGPEGLTKAFVVKLSNDLSTLLAGTLLGGHQGRQNYQCDDEAYDIAIDRNGEVWVVGQTNRFDFPVTPGCVGPVYSGKGDAFVAKLDADLTRLLAASHLGGMNLDSAVAVVPDGHGNVFVAGWTESTDFPMVPGGFDDTYSHEEEDGFVVKLSGDLRKLLASTYLGGNYDGSGFGDDVLSAMTLSADGKTLCVVGRTESENFPVTPKCYKGYTNDSKTAFMNHRNKKKPRETGTDDPDYGDGFVTLLDTDLAKLRYSTYLGGHNLEYVDAVLFFGNNLLVSGETYSYYFPRVTTQKKESCSRGFVVHLEVD